MPNRRAVTPVRPDSGVTWRWVAIAAIGLASVAGGSWLNYLQGQVADVRLASSNTAEKVNSQATQQAVTQQKVQDIDRKVDEVRKDVGDIKTLLQQIQMNQQQQIRDAPPPQRGH